MTASSPLPEVGAALAVLECKLLNKRYTNYTTLSLSISLRLTCDRYSRWSK
jgi:hypothetical protein